MPPSPREQAGAEENVSKATVPGCALKHIMDVAICAVNHRQRFPSSDQEEHERRDLEYTAITKPVAAGDPISGSSAVGESVNNLTFRAAGRPNRAGLAGRGGADQPGRKDER